MEQESKEISRRQAIKLIAAATGASTVGSSVDTLQSIADLSHGDAVMPQQLIRPGLNDCQ